jgi:hypothetical protein
MRREDDDKMDWQTRIIYYIMMGIIFSPLFMYLWALGKAAYKEIIHYVGS